MNRRLAILLHWLRGRRNGVRAVELIRFLASLPSALKAGRIILSKEECSDVFKVRLRGVENQLIWPKSVDLVWLYAVLAEQFYSNDWHFYETPETTVRPGDTVVDCGAAEGLFSLLVASRARKVYAVEPLPAWVECLRSTFENVSNVEILPYALSNETGNSRLQSRGFISQLGVNGDVRVNVETVDNLFLRKGIHVSYLKADLEGHDFMMLQGAQETIASYSPRIAITTYHQPPHAALMMKFLTSVNRRYRFRTRGIEAVAGAPVILHAWVEK